ncbi:MAG: hypothetical protein JOZ33_05155 [Acidobacteriaceae bacterium]|nr:hypothetical protein [Acidobacteriaceae bacterium]
MSPRERSCPDPRYLVGRYQPPAVITAGYRAEWITELQRSPGHFTGVISSRKIRLTPGAEPIEIRPRQPRGFAVTI